MNQVVNFLSLLAVTEEQGGVKRMLGVCLEFERIAKVVLDKAEKESHSRRKRKNNKEAEDTRQNQNGIAPNFTAPLTPTSQNQQHSPNTFAPTYPGNLNHQQPFDPNFNGFSPVMNDGNGSLPLDFGGFLDSPSTMQPTISEKDASQVSSEGFSPLNMGSFQQPFVPQDLWQMPQTLEWDWADMNNAGFPAFDGELGPNQVPPNGYTGT